MKKLIHSIIVLMLSATVFAQAPQSFKYQAVARDASGEVISNQAVSFQISVLQGSESGTTVYTETHVDSTNQFGLVTLEIGTGTTTNDFTGIDWSNNTYFIQIEMDVTGGTSYTLMGTSQLLSVPYALHAKTVKSYTETDPVFVSSVAAGITGTDTTNWNNKLESYTETDPVFGASVAGGITVTDTTNWNNKLDVEVDGSVTNEIQDLSLSSNTLSLTNDATTVDLSGYLDNTDNQNLLNVLAQGTDAGNYAMVNISQQGIGTANPNASAALEISSTTQGFLPPRMTDTEMNALTPVAGLQVYNTTFNLPLFYNGSEWRKLDGSLYIGKSYAGGIIFYIDGTGEHGLVCAESNQSTGALWGCYGTLITGADGTAVGTGAQNTIDIEAECTTAGTAADICANLPLNSYSDWFLPSKDELNLMYTNLHLNGFGGFVITEYWSSSEQNGVAAWVQGFNTDTPVGNFKSHTNYVRAVRAF